MWVVLNSSLEHSSYHAKPADSGSSSYQRTPSGLAIGPARPVAAAKQACQECGAEG